MLLLALAGIGSASAVLYGLGFSLTPLLVEAGLAAPGKGPLAAYPALASGLYGLSLLAALLVFRRGTPRGGMGLILAFSVVFRLLVLLTPPTLSDDMYRYIWEGRIQRAGFSPYQLTPEAPVLAGLRDTAIYPHVNRPSAVTIYPPGAQAFFLAIQVGLPDSVTGFRAVLVVADLFSILLVMGLLRRLDLDPGRAILYAWSPLTVFELSQSGHVDALMIPLVLLALWLRLQGRMAGAGLALGLATLVKLYPISLLPALARPREWRLPAAFAATVALGYLPHVLRVGGQVVGFLPRYFGPWEDFNIGLRGVVEVVLAPLVARPREAALLLCWGALAGCALYVYWRRAEAPVEQKAGWMAAAFLLLQPQSLHPWYVAWVIPFLCIRPVWGWVYFSGAVSLSYLKYVQEPPHLPGWVWAAEFLPLYGLLLLQGAGGLRPAPSLPGRLAVAGDHRT